MSEAKTFCSNPTLNSCVCVSAEQTAESARLYVCLHRRAKAPYWHKTGTGSSPWKASLSSCSLSSWYAWPLQLDITLHTRLVLVDFLKQCKANNGEDKHSILMMTEPGIIGKIGFNSCGLGVTLNFLERTNFVKTGVPVHILLRAALDCKSVQEWKNKVMNLLPVELRGTSSAIFACDASGSWLHLEFAGRDIRIVSEGAQQQQQEGKEAEQKGDSHLQKKGERHSKNLGHILWRTNHYLSDCLDQSSVLRSSFSRYERIEEIVTQEDDMMLHSSSSSSSSSFGGPSNKVEVVKRLLLDSSKEFPILRQFVYSKGCGLLGTITCIVMELKSRKMQITRGSPLKNVPFETFELYSSSSSSSSPLSSSYTPAQLTSWDIWRTVYCTVNKYHSLIFYLKPAVLCQSRQRRMEEEKVTESL